VKFLRLLLTCLAVLCTIALVVVLLAIAPAVQTWIAQRELSGTPGIKGSLDSLSAGFGEVDIEKLSLEANGAVLTLPSLKAKLTLSDAVVRRQFHIQSLVAKGWSLDLTQSGEAASPAPSGSATMTNGGSVTQVDAASMRRTLNLILGILSERRLPFDGSLDGVDLEGEILFAPLPGKPPARAHVVLSGGGLSAGNEGVFNFDITATLPDTSLPVSAASAHGKLSVSMDTQRNLNRVRIDTDLTDNCSSNQPSITVGAEISSGRDSATPTYHLDIVRAGRKLASVTANLPAPNGPLSGTWTLDLVESDVTRYFPDLPFPTVSLAGTGKFGSDAEFSKVHVIGSLNSTVSHLGTVAPILESVGTAKVGGDFEATRIGHQIQVDRLQFSISGHQPVAAVHSLQSFAIDEGSGTITSSDPAKDLFDATVAGLPLAWLPFPAEGIAISGGNVVGEVLIAQSGSGFDLRSKGPLTASGVSLLDDGKQIGKGFDLNLALTAHKDPKGMQATFAPFEVYSGGRSIARLEGSANRPAEADSATALTFKWTADLDAIEAKGAAPGAPWISGSAASGDLSATFGATTQLDGRIAVSGHDSSHSIDASIHAEIDANGGVTFQAPVKVSTGPVPTDLSFDGTCGRDNGGPWVDLKLTGGKVALGDLAVLAGPLIPSERAPLTSAGARDSSPFWGNLTGRAVVSFDEFSTRYSDLSNVGGTFNIDKGSIQLEGGRGGPTGNVLTNVDGSITFDANSEVPYVIKGTAASTDLEAESFFPKPKTGELPVFEGKFNVARTFTGKGVNLYDLVAHSGEEFHLTSASGIVRLLKADVADSLTEAPASVASDTLSTVGTVVGTAMGTKANILDSGKTKLAKNTEAVLNLTYQVSEIGFDKVDITAVRGFDGTTTISHIEMVSPEVRFTGSGRISNAMGFSLADQALSLDLQLSAQGETEDVMGKSGLLSASKDELGYTKFSQPLHFGGTLSHVDTSQWNDLLVKAAVPKPEPVKKGG